MQLLRPALLCVQAAEEQHHQGGEGILLRNTRGPAPTRIGENPLGFGLAAWRGIAVRQTVVGKPPAQRMKMIVPEPQSVEKILEGPYLAMARPREPADPLI